jgi:hypothetical protein
MMAADLIYRDTYRGKPVAIVFIKPYKYLLNTINGKI